MAFLCAVYSDLFIVVCVLHSNRCGWLHYCGIQLTSANARGLRKSDQLLRIDAHVVLVGW